MICPDCETKLEVQDASSKYGIGGNHVIAANYYCPECTEYFRWELGKGFEEWDWENELTASQRAHATIVKDLNRADAGPNWGEQDGK